MSRCFPYPPPDFGQSMIESIKLQKEIERAKKGTEREGKREKRQKREKATQSQNSVSSKHERRHKKRKPEEKNLLVQDQHSSKTSNDVIEQLEKSGLTEEHELDSPESSQDSTKRRKLLLPVSSPSTSGTVRINLPSLNQRDSESPLMDIKSELPSPLLRQIKSEMPLPSTRQRDSQPLIIQTAKRIVNEQPAADKRPCTLGRHEEATLGQGAAEPSYRTSSSKRIGSRSWQKKQFEDLANWNPLVSQVESWDVDDEWLSEVLKRHSSSYVNKPKAGREVLVCGNYTIPSQLPRACYLPEFETYQLPYVVPF
ncbi:hypothetical protein Cni_G25576 [Canna indica]|uniref:Uncharacterized protein n=1 Tax=Canna indica TaxID=4628 RepID=A0AAQ3KX87_9LILI|nr:hypothetical protein Cni_G25576 [Canna indica]